MPNQKFITMENGQKRLKTAIATSTGTGDAGKMICTNTDGTIDYTMLPKGVGLDTITVPAFENITANSIVSLFDDAGVTKARLADSSTIGKEAVGYCKDAVSTGGNAVIYLEGELDFAGATVNTDYFLGTTGNVTATAPNTTGSFIHKLGRCYDAGKIRFEMDEVVYID